MRVGAETNSMGGDELLAMGFDDLSSGRWHSYVGGEDEASPSWRLDDGGLLQPTEDGLVRAFVTGDPGWTDYRLEARVNILSPGVDSRAGLVFRDDGKGFYVLRFTRSTSKMQLMFHGRAPFGWHELATIPVESDRLEKEWVALAVEARGPFLRCFVEGQCVIDLVDSRSLAGRAGFYACESRAKFDGLRVFKKSPMSLVSSSLGSTPLAPSVSYWFRETFTDARSSSWQLPQGWSVGGALCACNPAHGGSSVARLVGASFSDGVVHVRVRIPADGLTSFLDEIQNLVRGAAADGDKSSQEFEVAAEHRANALGQGEDPPVPPASPGRAGLVVRGQGGQYYAFILDRSTGHLVLVRRDEDTGLEELLGKAEFKYPPEDRWYTMALQAKGEQLLAVIDGVPVIAAQDTRGFTGYIGLFAHRGAAVFADLVAASGTA